MLLVCPGRQVIMSHSHSKQGSPQSTEPIGENNSRYCFKNKQTKKLYHKKHNTTKVATIMFHVCYYYTFYLFDNVTSFIEKGRKLRLYLSLVASRYLYLPPLSVEGMICVLSGCVLSFMMC